MTAIEINSNITKEERNEIWFEHHPEFKMIDENTGMIDNYAIVKFYERDPQKFDDAKEKASDICERYTNIEIMQALVLMFSEGQNNLYELQKYIEEFNKMGDYDRPIDFYPDATNEREMREYLKEELSFDEQEKDEYIDAICEDCKYTPIGALVHNF